MNLFLILAVTGFTLTSKFASGANVWPAPCASPSSACDSINFMKCSQVLGSVTCANDPSQICPSPVPPSLPFLIASPGPSYSNPTVPSIPVSRGIVSLVDTLVKRKIGVLYWYGIDSSGTELPDPTVSPRAAAPSGRSEPLPICNLVASPTPEISVPAQIPYPTPSKSCGSLQMDSTHSYPVDAGSLGNAYLNGLYAQTYQCFEQQVFHELSASMPQPQTSISVLDSLPAPSPLPYFNQYQSNLALAQTAAICANTPASCLQIPNLCTTNLGGYSTIASDSTALPNSAPCPAEARVAICQLESIEADLMSAYAHAIYGEIQSRAQSSWFGGGQVCAHQIIKNDLTNCQNNATNTARQNCKAGSTSPLDSILDPDCAKSQYARSMNDCNYPKALQTDLTRFSVNFYPSSGSCRTPNPQAGCQ